MQHSSTGVNEHFFIICSFETLIFHLFHIKCSLKSDSCFLSNCLLFGKTEGRNHFQIWEFIRPLNETKSIDFREKCLAGVKISTFKDFIFSICCKLGGYTESVEKLSSSCSSASFRFLIDHNQVFSPFFGYFLSD